jgi:hypothetical protein
MPILHLHEVLIKDVVDKRTVVSIQATMRWTEQEVLTTSGARIVLAATECATLSPITSVTVAQRCFKNEVQPLGR